MPPLIPIRQSWLLPFPSALILSMSFCSMAAPISSGCQLGRMFA